MLELPTSDRELLQGFCELHVHAAPDISERPFSELELARQARDAGYRAILFKSHYTANADRAQIIGKIIPGIQVYGGIVLNHPVGGINPHAVEAAIGFGAKEVWMPTLHAANHVKIVGVPGYPKHNLVNTAVKPRRAIQGISILDSSGAMIPEVDEILGLISDAGIILGTSHLSLEETLSLVEAARRAKVRKVLITHPGWEGTDWPLEALVHLVEMGGTLEYCYNSCMPHGSRLDPKRIVQGMKRVGAEHCVMASDFGQPYNPNPIDGMRQFIKVMMALEISEQEVDIMTRKNPARLLDIL